MNKGKLALRLIYACGLAVYWVADRIGDSQAAPDWFAKDLSEAVLYVTITTAALWIAFEVVLHFVRRRGLWATALAVSFAAVAEPAHYLMLAALYGAEQADFDTWHLVALFVLMHQVYAMVVTLLIAAVIALLLWIARCVQERRQAQAQ